MLEDALKYPLNSDDRVATLIIGGLLLVFSFLLIPAFILQGYLLRVLESAASGDDAAPSFTDWGELLVDGLKLLVVSLVYGLVISIPFVLAALVGFGGIAGNSTGVTGVGVLLFLLATLVAIVVGYFLPAALTNFALEGRMGAAFDFGAIREAGFSSKYLVGVLLGVVLGLVIQSVASPFVVLLVGIPALFYGQVVTYYCFARGFADATDSGTARATSPTESAPTESL